MTQIVRLLFVLTLSCTNTTQEAANEQEKAPDYFPLKVGTKWNYEAKQAGKTIKLENQIAKLETIDGKSLAVLEKSVNGTVQGTEHLAATEKGTFRHRVDGTELSPPICVLKNTLKKDDTWETVSTIANEQIKVKAKVLGAEDVTVPAGKYKAFRVEVEYSIAGMQATVTFWFAPDVGIVKQSMDGSEKNFIELTKFEAGK
jgi:hypothetical protein